MAKNIGKLVVRLKAERKLEGKTQKAMAEVLGISCRQYQRMEAGGMPVWMLEEACEILGLKVLVLNKEVLL